MDSIKVIDISSLSSKSKKKKLTKKQLYKEILSSSDKVKEIINNRKKTQRFDYLNSEAFPTLKTKIEEKKSIQVDKNKFTDEKNNKSSTKLEALLKKEPLKVEEKKQTKSPKRRRKKTKEKEKNDKSKITNYFKANKNNENEIKSNNQTNNQKKVSF